jgi:serine/threonine-protein kinase
MNLQIGDQFQHFQVSSLIAQGGMSTIYGVVDLLTGNNAALKIPHENFINDPAFAERFQRELEICRTLNHPAIQKAVETGTFNRIPYLVTELIEGVSLRELMTQPFTADRALAIFKKIAEAVIYLHANGVVHRDLKPENILVKDDGQPVIIDFGMSLTRNARRVTYANTNSAGTPDYMAPEQIEGARGDARTDQYALGTILYEMLAGELPFSGDSTLAVMAQHLHAPVPRLDQLRPAQVSPQLCAVITRAMQRDQGLRYPDIQAMMTDLDYLDHVDTTILSQDKPTTMEAVAIPPEDTESIEGENRTNLILAVAVGIALVFVGILVFLQSIP